MVDFSELLEHPDKEDIISRLLSGDTPKTICSELKLKYPAKEQAHLRLSIKVLRDFAESDFTNFPAQFSKDLAESKIPEKATKLNKKLTDSLVNNKTYRERLNEVADNEIDIKKKFNALINVANDRLEQVFDKIQENPSSFNGDPILLRYFESMMNMIEKYNKIIFNAPDQVIQHNVTVQAVNGYVNVMQETIREILYEMDPQLASNFMERLEARCKDLNMPNMPTQEERANEVQILSQKIIKI